MLRRISQEHLIMLFLLLVAVTSIADLAADLAAGVEASHAVREAVISVLALAALCWLAVSLLRRNREIGELHRELEQARNLPPAESPEVVEARRRLAAVIAGQFAQWGLTGSEQEVGLLLLKGFSLREIAALRGTSEKTIRQQASAIYQKSGLSGRHALSAWFIEDFL